MQQKIVDSCKSFRGGVGVKWNGDGVVCSWMAVVILLVYVRAGKSLAQRL